MLKGQEDGVSFKTRLSFKAFVCLHRYCAKPIVLQRRQGLEVGIRSCPTPVARDHVFFRHKHQRISAACSKVIGPVWSEDTGAARFGSESCSQLPATCRAIDGRVNVFDWEGNGKPGCMPQYCESRYLRAEQDRRESIDTSVSPESPKTIIVDLPSL